MADLLAEAAGPAPRFAAVMCEDIERSGRDTFNALKLEKQLTRLQAALYETFSIELLFNKDMHQVTIWATVTDSTPRIVAAIMAGSEDPAPATGPPVSDLSQHLGTCQIRSNQETVAWCGAVTVQQG